jgi:L-ascorbate metabolism protein UlaG (beta-lactamase superfamily)
MQISYFGLSAFKITSKDHTTILDPFSKESGLIPPRGSADLILLSQPEKELYSYTQGLAAENQFIVNGPGEYDVKDHAITGVAVRNSKNEVITIYLITVEDIRILNLAHIPRLALSQDELDDIGEVDILLIPVGGDDVIDYEDAVKTVNLIEPKIVIPSHYQIKGLDVKAFPAEKFLREMGGKFETLDKLSVKKKDLPIEGTKVIVLEPLR